MKFANLSHNQLGLLEGGCNKDPMDTWLSIKPLKTLEILDLSYNRIDLLLNDTFDKLVNLRKLFLSNNKINLSSWKPNLTNLVHLEYLDLSYNNFQTLPLHTRLMLHKMDKTSKNLTFNLEGNTFSCTCKNIQFLKWLASSDIHFEHLERYICEFFDYEVVPISNNLNQIIKQFESECTSNMWLIWSSSA